MMHMTGYTFTFPLKHSEIVALAIRNWPMPCVVRIIKPHPIDQFCFSYVRNKSQFSKHNKRKFNRSRRHRP